MGLIKNTMKAGKVLKHAFKVQSDLRDMKSKLSDEVIEVEGLAGEIKVRMFGDHRVEAIEYTGPTAPSTDALIKVINEAHAKVNAIIKERTADITKGTALEGFDIDA